MSLGNYVARIINLINIIKIDIVRKKEFNLFSRQVFSSSSLLLCQYDDDDMVTVGLNKDVLSFEKLSSEKLDSRK